MAEEQNQNKSKTRTNARKKNKGRKQGGSTARPVSEGNQVRPTKPGKREVKGAELSPGRVASSKPGGRGVEGRKPNAAAANEAGRRDRGGWRPRAAAEERQPSRRFERRAPEPVAPGKVEPPPPSRPKEIVLSPLLTVRELAQIMQTSPIDVIKVLMNLGIMANINQQLDFDTAAIVGAEMGFEVKAEEPEAPVEEEEEAPKTLRQILAEQEPAEKLEPRPPVVTVLGHVDHGKTTLLDAIRDTNVVEGEAGGITQRIGAYQVEVDGRKITFLDTPGHEAFTAMRARGAQVTDLAVLVVAADDGVMPQTREAIDHARAAGVPILVALNKMDKPNANPDRVKQQLADVGLTVEDWGGDVICVPISAKQKTGIDELLENILLVTEVADLKANPHRPAVGTVVEGRVDRSRGVMATLLVQAGTLRVGDVVVIGDQFGRVRAMFDDKGQAVQEAKPSTPVAILGLAEVPSAGNVFEVVEDERAGRALAAQRREEKRETAAAGPRRSLTLEDLFRRAQAGEVRELNVILKAAMQGGIEPITTSLEQLGSEGLKVHILHASTGDITESDVMLASASKAIVVGFSVDVDQAARRLADAEGVDIRVYDVIYQLLEDVEKALKGLLEPTYEEEEIGRAEVRATFRIPKRGIVAGCYVLEGKITRNALARIRRGEALIYDGRVDSLKRFTDDVREVAAGFECGVGLEGFEAYEVGDIIQFYIQKRQEAAA
ncbi:MAG: translation initiation factor IF-2 [Anaerolineae bacterium]